jgi:malonyl-CoA O-methyltransferase
MADPLIDKKEVARAFGRAASNYDAHAVLQREVMTRLDERLGLMNIVPGWVLDAGCGTGLGLRMLQARYPKADIVGLDLAMPMLQVARGHEANPGLPGFIRRLLPNTPARPAHLCADIERLPFKTSSIDLIWSSLALQWVGDLDAAFKELHRAIAPNGLLLFATFGPDTLKELRQAFAKVDGGTHVSRFIDMHDIGDMLVHAGFQHPVMEMELLTLTYADLKSMLLDLKGIGAHNATSDRARGMMGKSAWLRLEQAYETFRRERRLPATYEVIYGHAWAGDKRRLADGRQIIQFNIERRKSGLR